jgi:hypothetical protein
MTAPRWKMIQKTTEVRKRVQESRKQEDQLVLCTERETTTARQGAPHSPEVWTHILHFTITSIYQSCRLTLTTASPGHPEATVTVLTPEGPHGVDAAALPTHVGPQALIHVYVKHKILSRSIFQDVYCQDLFSFKCENEVIDVSCDPFHLLQSHTVLMHRGGRDPK